MPITCSKGHVNDDANRFCDQCGEPLSAPAGASAPAAVPVDVAAAAGTATPTSISCPTCGQENVPGTLFCDNCGAPLPSPQPVAAPDLAPAGDLNAISGQPGPADAVASTSATTPTISCPQCGTSNDPANRFCDNCGAELSGAADASAPAAPPEPLVDTVPAEASVPIAPVDVAAEPVGSGIPGVASDALPEEASAPAASSVSTGSAADNSTAASAVPAPAADASAERQQLEEQVATQQRVIAQLEQTESLLGAATPAAVRQSLEEARSALAQAEQSLAALPPARPPVDPAEVARLEEQVATQQRVIAQLEQTESLLGAATPAAVRQSLEEARSALVQTQQSLTELTGSAGPAHPLPTALDVATQRAEEQAQAAPPEPVAPMPEPQSVPVLDAEPTPTPEPTPVAAAPVPVAAPTPPPPVAAAPVPVAAPPVVTDQLPPAAPQGGGPRLVGRDGKTITLPRSGGELIIGREDPISGIHPQVDLTPFGGEAGGVSRRHASLREQGGQWMLTDLDSTNYTRIDGTRLAPNTPTPVPNGARVQFGRVDFEFHV